MSAGVRLALARSAALLRDVSRLSLRLADAAEGAAGARLPSAPGAGLPAGGPPADWLAKVRAGAPHLLEPAAPRPLDGYGPAPAVAPAGPARSRRADAATTVERVPEGRGRVAPALPAPAASHTTGPGPVAERPAITSPSDTTITPTVGVTDTAAPIPASPVTATPIPASPIPATPIPATPITAAAPAQLRPAAPALRPASVPAVRAPVPVAALPMLVPDAPRIQYVSPRLDDTPIPHRSPLDLRADGPGPAGSARPAPARDAPVGSTPRTPQPAPAEPIDRGREAPAQPVQDAAPSLRSEPSPGSGWPSLRPSPAYDTPDPVLEQAARHSDLVRARFLRAEQERWS